MEDDEVDALFVRRALQKGGFEPSIRLENSLAGFKEAIQAGGWDVILSDHGLAGFSSAQAFEIYRQGKCDCPFILVSGHIGEEQAASAMRFGVHDYVLKDSLARLIPAIERALEECHLRRDAARMQRELEQRANDLKLFVEQAPAAIAMLDSDMRYIAASGRWLADYGLSGQEIAGRSHYEVFPEMTDEWKAVHRRCMAGAIERNDRDRFVRADGSVQWIRWEVQPWYRSAGVVGGIFIFSEDISGHVRAENTLKMKEWMLSRGQSLANTGTFYRDFETNTVTGSEEAYRLLGPGSERLLNESDSLAPFIHPEDRERYTSAKSMVRQHGTGQAQMLRILRTDGVERQVRSVVEAVGDAAGKRIGAIRVIQDITDLHDALRDLRHKEWLLSYSQKLAQVGTLYRNLTSGASTASDEVYRILGLAADTLGESFDGLARYIHPEDRTTFDAEAERLRSEPASIANEFRVIRCDGTIGHLASMAKSIADQDGRITGIIRVIQDMTAQKQANAALREKEWLLSRAQSVGRFGTWFRNLDARTVTWSDETFRIFGMNPAPSVDFEAYADAIVPEDRSRFLTERERVTRSGGSFTLEFRIRRPDGAIRTLWMVAERIFASAGRSNGILGIVQDITERKATETAMREREWVLSRAQEAGQIGTWFWDRLTDRMTVSEQTYRILGVTSETWGHTLDAYRAMIHPEDRDTFEVRRMVKREELGGRFSDDYRIIRPDGTIRYVTHVGEFFLGDDGSLKGLIGILQDITERKQNEAELREKEWILSRAQQAAHIGTFYRDIHGKFVKWSDETYRIFGVDPATFKPSVEAFIGLIHPEDRPAYFISRQRAFSEGAPVLEECRIVRPDGKVRNVMLMAEVVQDSSGQPSGLMGIVQDITERKVNEGRLVQAQKLEAMGRLTAGVAHDFNNLLTIINGNLELMQRDMGENQSISPMLETVLKATGRGADLIRQMSAFNRNRPLKQRAMSPREAIGNLGRLVPRTLGEAIQVHTAAAPDVWDILSDPAQLESALLNMAINARDAMPNGGKLNLSARNVTLGPNDPQGGPGDFVMFAIEDTGTGILPEVLDKIFEPFFTTKEQGKGTGLGLSMVFGFVQQCGGHLRVYTEVGVGTAFRLYFPRHVPAGAVKSEVPARNLGATPIVNTHNAAVLIVEDQEEIRTLAVNIFERMGYRTVVCPDAHAGLHALQQDPSISLLFSDITLPGGKSGAQLAEDALRLRPSTPILLTSGFTEQAIDLTPLLDRGVMFQEKPYQLGDIQTKVEKLLSRTEPQAGAAAPDSGN